VQSNLEHRRKKVVGEPDEGKPHVRFDVAGNGNQAHDAQAPFPDPTDFCKEAGTDRRRKFTMKRATAKRDKAIL